MCCKIVIFEHSAKDLNHSNKEEMLFSFKTIILKGLRTVLRGKTFKLSKTRMLNCCFSKELKYILICFLFLFLSFFFACMDVSFWKNCFLSDEFLNRMLELWLVYSEAGLIYFNKSKFKMSLRLFCCVICSNAIMNLPLFVTRKLHFLSHEDDLNTIDMETCRVEDHVWEALSILGSQVQFPVSLLSKLTNAVLRFVVILRGGTLQFLLWGACATKASRYQSLWMWWKSVFEKRLNTTFYSC